eukprot:gene16125-7483_t
MQESRVEVNKMRSERHEIKEKLVRQQKEHERQISRQRESSAKLERTVERLTKQVIEYRQYLEKREVSLLTEELVPVAIEKFSGVSNPFIKFAHPTKVCNETFRNLLNTQANRNCAKTRIIISFALINIDGGMAVAIESISDCWSLLDPNQPHEPLWLSQSVIFIKPIKYPEARPTQIVFEVQLSYVISNYVSFGAEVTRDTKEPEWILGL